MAEGVVAGLSGDWDTVVRAVNAVFNGARFVLLAEDCQAMERPHFKPEIALNVNTRLPRGRAFDPDREVRWREIAGGRFVVTYLSDLSAGGALPAGIGFQLSPEKWETRATSQKLYGKWSDALKDWIEVSVPGASGKYQSLVDIGNPPNSLQIASVDYSRNGIVQMTRFCVVKEYRER